MPNDEHIRLIKAGVEEWNAWRELNPSLRPDLSKADLHGFYLNGANFRGADLSHADLSKAFLGGAHFRGADLSGAELYGAQLIDANLIQATVCTANLRQANLFRTRLSEVNLKGSNLGEAELTEADLSSADLNNADLSEANLSQADLTRANLSRTGLRGAKLIGTNLTRTHLTGADLSEADLRGANLTGAELTEADLNDARIGYTTFGDNDLSTIKGLETVNHTGPSTIGIDTLFRSDGKIPDGFLRAAGIPEDFITYVPSLVGRAIEFYSCFISYSHQDEEFSRRLHSRMRSDNLRTWYAPEDMKGGRKLHEEIFHAIQIHDKLLLVLSENSMKSEWVMTKIRRARRVERAEKRRKLFPIRLVDFEVIQNWECFDAASQKDLADEVREYYIPDFTNWKDYDAFEAEFAKLLRDLRATEK